MARWTWTIVALSLLACGSDPAPARIPRPKVCSTLSGGCSCGTMIVGDGTPVCDATSVVREAGQKGFCCQADFYCQCRVKECTFDPNQPICICGNAQNDPGSLRVDDCNQQMPGLTCCLNSFGCMCGTNPCGDPGESVPNCTISDVTMCDSVDQVVASCL